MANAPDEKLVRRAQKGDKAAFAELFTRYEGRIFGYVYRMVGDRAWAEDIAQEAFIQAHQYLNRLGRPTILNRGSTASRGTWRWTGCAEAGTKCRSPIGTVAR